MPGSAAGGQVGGPRSGRLIRAVCAVTFLVLAGVMVAASLITSDVIRNQERLILRERTGEAAAVLGSAFTGSQVSLRLLGTLARSGQAHGALFPEAARSVTTASGQAFLVTAQRGPGTRVLAAAGDGPAVGTMLPADQARHPGIPVLFMSGYSQDVLGPRGALDADAPPIQKPFAAQELLKTVRARLG
jgi:hypothetical protein